MAAILYPLHSDSAARALTAPGYGSIPSLAMKVLLALILLAAGAPGKRSALPHARIMIHQPHGGVQGQAADIHIYAEEILKNRGKLNEILSKGTRVF